MEAEEMKKKQQNRKDYGVILGITVVFIMLIIGLLVYFIFKLDINGDMEQNKRLIFGISVHLMILAVLMIVHSIILFKQNKQIKDQKNQLVEAVGRAESMNDSKTLFISRISHSVRTPLNSIVGLIEIAIRNIDDKEKVIECLKKVRAASYHLISLANDVINMGRMGRGEISLASNQINLEVFSENCISIITGKATKKNIKIETKIDVSVFPRVIGDESKLRQAILNILDNAVEYNKEGGTVFFRVFEIASDSETVTYCIEVEDNGIGMKESELQNIWKVYSTGEINDSSVDIDNIKGLGLGLSISKNYIDMMGGTISVKSKPNTGSVFSITVPFVIDKSEVEEKKDNDASLLKSLKLLLAEDNELSREIAAELLQDEGAEVVQAENGKVAYNIYMENPEGTFDAIIMDITMPVMNGLEASRRIRFSDKKDSVYIPIVAMTANAFDADKKMCEDAGMDGFVIKPIEMGKLMDTLLSCIKGRNRRIASQLEEANRNANVDALTGIKNKNAFILETDKINKKIEGKLDKLAFSVVICDLNGLKQVNDTLGHEKGDKFLVNATKVLITTFKNTTLYRIGGDEFAAIITGEDYKNREKLFEGLKSFMNTMGESDGISIDNVSFACGMSDYNSETDDSFEPVLRRADENMYNNKRKMKMGRID